MMRRRGLVLVVLAMLLLATLVATVSGLYWGTGPSLRCQDPAEGPVEPGWSARRVVSGNQVRCYHLYVPASADLTSPAPVVVSLHGFLSNPESQAWISGWHRVADREGFLVAYPQGTSWPQRWNAGASWGAGGVNDVAFFRDLLEDLAGIAAVDRSRVYVNGFSNGGGMTVRIACDAADQVAAIGTVAAAVVGMEQCDPKRPVPAMAFHGTADSIVNYEGGKMRGHALPKGADVTRAPTSFLGAEDWVGIWAERNGCDPVPKTLPQQGEVRGVRYTGCDGNAETILYTIEEGGHTWPGGAPIPAVGKTSRDIDATEEMWRFFQGYRVEDEFLVAP